MAKKKWRDCISNITKKESKLTKMIEKNEEKIVLHQEKVFKAKELCSMGKITKAEFHQLKSKHSNHIRELRDEIRRKKNARQALMKQDREKEEKKKDKKKKKSFFF